jgi:hypothetical protein
MRYELADYEWIAIRPMLPNKRVDQKMSSGGDALWQACCQLPCLRSTRVNQAMAAP